MQVELTLWFQQNESLAFQMLYECCIPLHHPAATKNGTEFVLTGRSSAIAVQGKTHFEGAGRRLGRQIDNQGHLEVS